MNPTAQLELMTEFVAEVKRLHIESLKIQTAEDARDVELMIALAARLFVSRIVA